MHPGSPELERRTMRWLMDGVERLLALFEREGVVAWLDWGTLLGAERHRNIIPWDYDADFCLLLHDYERVVDLFARRGGTIGGLTLRPDFYNERSTCCAVVPDDPPNPAHALDLVAYRHEGDRVRHLMSATLLAEYPGEYAFQHADVFPLSRVWLVGRRAWVPSCVEKRLLSCYGPGWRSFPEGRSASALTSPPLCELTGIVRAPTTVPATAYGDAAELCDAREGAWRKGGPGIDRAWVVDAGALAALEGASASEALAALERGSFTDLVWAADRALWGKVQVGAIGPGDTLVVPPGARVFASPEAA